MEKDQLTFNDLPTVVGELCDRITSMEIGIPAIYKKQWGKSADGKTFQAVRNQREHARPHDRTGGLCLS